MTTTSLYIPGTLEFSPKKITLHTKKDIFYVRDFSLPKWSVHGDYVKTRIVKNAQWSRLAEVEIVRRIARSQQSLIARIITKKWKQYWSIIKEQWIFSTPISQHDQHKKLDHNALYHVSFDKKGTLRYKGVFARNNDIDIEERIILEVAKARTYFSENLVQEVESMQTWSLAWRTDFRDWYVLTIDWPDAKDLDDAISVKRCSNGNWILVVHVADVAEYVREWSLVDKEAFARGTSIYTPWKVIPMLPEKLSNELCSLHPWSTKLTLSCIMEITKTGNVRNTKIVQWIIDSNHRGIYENIWDRQCILKKWPQHIAAWSLDEAIVQAFEVYEILKKRRKKEGKITFESTEIWFEFDNTTKVWPIKPLHVHKRVRNDAHKLIEECMILANEEVAKWCHKNKLPFISRIHGLPSDEQQEIIGKIMRQDSHDSSVWPTKNIEPINIQQFLENLDSPDDLYRYSRLLLPKMAKAAYSDQPFRHFWLALQYYAHFTSPIRRYPDLQLHRIIKEKINGTLTKNRIKHYTHILKKVSIHCSSQEVNAESIERSMMGLYACRYMHDKIGVTYSWIISGIAEFAYFVELENGIEITIYLPRRRKYSADMITWILRDNDGKKIARIGDCIQVIIDSIDMNTRRILWIKK